MVLDSSRKSHRCWYEFILIHPFILYSQYYNIIFAYYNTRRRAEFGKQFIRQNYNNNNIISCLKWKSIIISIDRVDKHWFGMIIMIIQIHGRTQIQNIVHTHTPAKSKGNNLSKFKSLSILPTWSGLTILYCWLQSTLYLPI